ncbi:MAG: glycosyltransferase family 4 protein [Stenotrophomonas maltophilia]|uniref:glycosyltransferase family 4 protein n=1 Tax=Stenotrophomonas TaxID=40323 RepID=UPI0013D8E797|nr:MULTISPECIES: glycosyltransferase family 4 protein [Stenotrophomonas]MBS4801896.1 glycosyltransferase family 4 protein [Stenotrophomonas maltophilia]MDG9988535.1 glycosyltransferase family 4 protein [Stenotrophomonas sp. GD04024]
MKKTIAIVSPSPVPFVNGGIENLTWSLAGYLNGAGDVHVELIKVPSPEYDFESLMTSYERFSLLDLTHFDSIISVKYPAWMVRHPDHRIYMAHCLRGLYDTYPEQQMGLSLPAGAPAEVEKLWSIVNRKHFDRYDLPAIFDAAQKVLREGGNSAWTALPSPLVRSVVHRLDAIAMRDVSVFSAISATVAKRKSYFPAEAQVHVAVPPSGLVPKSPDPQDYIFTVSRLDAPKRIDLLVQAMRQTKGETRLLIAGTGPQLSVLKQLAGEDARIEFVGYVGDEHLADYYRNALCVAFVPQDEDLGLITLEAMSSGKPVITTRDSGGPTEFVEDGVTGWICEPTPSSLSAAFNKAALDKNRTAEMGRVARDRIAGVANWPNVASVLLGPVTSTQANSFVAGSRSARVRKRIVVLSSFPVFPPRGGGQARIFHLWRRIARHHDVIILALTSASDAMLDREIAPGLREIVVPVTQEQQDHERVVSQSLGWQPASDVAFAMRPDLTPEYRRILLSLLPDAALLVASHPYAAAVVRDVELPTVWYEAHNHEAPMKRGMYGDTPGANSVVAAIDELEGWLCKTASKIVAVSDADARALGERHEVAADRFIIAVNGVDLDSVAFRDQEARKLLAARFGLHRPVAMMLASWHGPNLEAVDVLIRHAEELKHVDFCIIGSASGAFKDRVLPENVHFLGMVTDDEKDALLGAATFAVNPMVSGGGSNLKLLDYMASGAPVVTSAFGARGTGVSSAEAWIYDGEDLSQVVRSLLNASGEDVETRVRHGRSLVEREFSWDVVASRVIKYI